MVNGSSSSPCVECLCRLERSCGGDQNHAQQLHDDQRGLAGSAIPSCSNLQSWLRDCIGRDARPQPIKEHRRSSRDLRAQIMLYMYMTTLLQALAEWQARR